MSNTAPTKSRLFSDDETINCAGASDATLEVEAFCVAEYLVEVLDALIAKKREVGDYDLAISRAKEALMSAKETLGYVNETLAANRGDSYDDDGPCEVGDDTPRMSVRLNGYGFPVIEVK